MRIISPAVHGSIAYLAVLSPLLAPSLFNLRGTPSFALYVLAAILFLAVALLVLGVWALTGWRDAPGRRVPAAAR